MGVQRALERIKHHAVLRAGLDLDGEHAEAVDQFEEAVIRRRLHGDDVAGLGDRLQRQQQGFLSAVGDADLGWIDRTAHRIEIAVGDLAAKRRFAKRWCISDCAVFDARHHPFHAAMQGFGGGVGHAGIRNTQGNGVRLVKAIVDPFHQGPAADARRLAVRPKGGRGANQAVDAHAANVETGLGPGFHAALSFQFDVGLADGRDADPDLLAHPTQRRQFVARP